MSIGIRATAVALGTILLLGCSSPEARRSRAEGQGADVGNRGGEVRLHGGSGVYYRTPTEGRGLGSPEMAGGPRRAG